MRAGDIFGFGTGESNSALLLGTPGDSAARESKRIAQGGLTVIDIAAPVGIHVPEYGVASRNPAAVHKFVV